MILIGLSGHRGCGKDTIADLIKQYILDNQLNVGYYRLGFADALYQEVKEATKCTIEYIKAHKDNFRLILQGWGTDYRRNIYGKDYWLHKFLIQYNDLPSNCVVICNDVRFLNEYNLIREIGGQVWRIRRLPERLDMHPSETELDEVTEWDQRIDNSLSLNQLKETMQPLIKQILPCE